MPSNNPPDRPDTTPSLSPEAPQGWSRSSDDSLFLCSDDPTEPDDGAQSIRRTISVLQAVAHGRQRGFRLTEIADITGIARPTAHRLLSVLTAEGLTKRSPSSGRYYIGPQISLLALARPAMPPLLRCVEGHLADISGKFGETTFFSIRSGLDSVCVARSLGSFPIQVLAIEVGDRRPLTAITSGMAMLATLPEATVDRILTHDTRRAHALGVDTTTALRQISEARTQGFVLRDGGTPPGTKAIAVGLALESATPFGAISVAGTAARMSIARCQEIAAYARTKADHISTALRHAGWPATTTQG